jgi:hypothetical protein
VTKIIVVLGLRQIVPGQSTEGRVIQAGYELHTGRRDWKSVLARKPDGKRPLG